MLDLQQGLARNHPRSFNPIYRSNKNCVGTRTDFGFWDDKKYDDFGKHENEIRFQPQTDIEDDYGAYSPQLWRTSSFRYEDEASLLPCNHRYSYPSPTSRLQAIVDGRREMMDKIKDMPESCYELSLKDIVDHQHISESVEEDLVINEKSLNTKTGIEIKKVKKKEFRRDQITRTESMDSGVYLLKMFMPSSLGLNKKSTRGNSSKVSPKPTFVGSEKTSRMEWWKNILGENKNRNGLKSRLSASNSSSSNGSSRNEESKFTNRCWSFNAKNCKPRRQRGCFL